VLMEVFSFQKQINFLIPPDCAPAAPSCSLPEQEDG
jgi:hypothetical protein